MSKQASTVMNTVFSPAIRLMNRLSLDPDLKSYYLIDMLVTRLPNLAETMGHSVIQSIRRALSL